MLKKFLFDTLQWRGWFGAKTEKLQEKRKRYLEKLILLGVFYKVEIPGNLPHLWVKPAFYTLDFETQSEFVNVVYAYYFTANPISNTVVLFDSRTGEKIGEYAEAYGGLRLD